MNKYAQWCLSLVLFVVFGWDFYGKISEHSHQLALIRSDALHLWPIFLGVFLLFFLAMFLRAHRWALILGDKSLLWLSYRSIAIGYLVQCPLSKLGEFARLANQKRYSSVGMGQIVSTMFVDRLLDVFSLIVVLIATAALSQGLMAEHFPQLSGLLPKLVLMMSVGLLGLIFVLVFQKKILLLLERWNFIPRAVVTLFSHFVKQFSHGLVHCKKWQTIVYLLVSNGMVWILYFLCFYWTLAYFPQMPTTMTLSDYFFVFAIGSLGALVPVPGGLPYPLFTQQALVLVSPELNESVAFSISLVMYLVNFWVVNLLCGGSAWLYQMFAHSKKAQV